MAIEKDKLTIDVELDSKGAIKGLQSLNKGLKTAGDSAKKSSKNVKTFDSALDNAFKSITLLNQGLQLAISTYNGISRAVDTLTDAYSQQENAERGLINTLRLQGEFTKEAIEDFSAFATELQRTTVIGDEVTLSFLKQAKAMGLSNEQAKLAVTAAGNLSAATGRDLNSAFAQTLKTFGGFAGELGEVIPELKNLNAAQLRAGAAAELLTEKFQGEAEALTELFSGASTQRANAFGDLLEELGRTIVEVFDLQQIEKDATKFFQDLTSTVIEFRDRLKTVDFDRVGRALKEIGQTLSVVILPVLIKMALPLALIAAKFVAIGVAVAAVVGTVDLLVKNLANLEKVGAVVLDGLEVAWNGFQIAVIKGWSVIFEGARDLLDFVSQIGGAFGKVAKSMSSSVDTVVNNLERNLRKKIQQSRQDTEDLATSFENLDDKGAFGGIVDIANELSRAFSEGVVPNIREAEESIGDVNTALNKSIELTKEEVSILEKFRAENLAIEREINALGATEAELAQQRLDIALQEIEAKRDGLSSLSSIAQFSASAILDEQSKLNIILSQKQALTRQVQVINELIIKQNESADALARMRGDQSADPSLVRFKEQSDALDVLLQKYVQIGVIGQEALFALKMGFIDSLPAITAFEKNQKSILLRVESLRESLKQFATEQAGLDPGGVFVRNLEKALKRSESFVNEFSRSTVTTLREMAADALPDSGMLSSLFSNAADFVEMISGGPGGIDLSISAESQANIASFINSAKKTFDYVSGAFSTIGSGIGSVVDTIAMGADFFSQAANFIISFDQDSINTLKELPQKLMEGLANIGPFIAALGEAFVKGIRVFIENIGMLLNQLGPILKNLVTQIAGALIDLLGELPGIIFKLMEALVPAFLEALKQLPSLFEAVIKAIPEIFDAIISFLPQIIIGLVEALPSLMESLTSAFIEIPIKMATSFIDVFLIKGGALDIALAIAEAILIELPKAIVKGVVNGLKAALGALFDGFEYPLPDIAPFTKEVENVVNAVSTGAAKIANEIFSVIDLPGEGGGELPGKPVEEKIRDGLVEGGKKVVNGLGRMMSGIAKAFGTIWSVINSSIFQPLINALSSVGKFFQGLFTSIGNILQGVFGGVLQTLSDGLVAGMSFVGDILGVLAETIQSIFSKLPEVISGAFEIVKGIFEGLVSIVRQAFEFVRLLFDALPGVVNTAFQFVKDILDGLAVIVQGAFQFVVDLFAGLKDTVDKAFESVSGIFADMPETVNNAFKPVIDLFGNLETTVQTAFDPVLTLFSSLESTISDLGGTIGSVFSNLETAFNNVKKPFEDITAALDKILEPFNSLTSALNKFKPPSLGGGGGGGGGGAVETVKNVIKKATGFSFAGGGLVTGMGFVETPGEFVFKKSAVEAIGAPTLAQINKTGSLPNGGQSVALNIAEGAIVINQTPGQSSTDIADMIFESLKEKSINGETVIFATGVRAN